MDTTALIDAAVVVEINSILFKNTSPAARARKTTLNRTFKYFYVNFQEHSRAHTISNQYIL